MLDYMISVKFSLIAASFVLPPMTVTVEIPLITVFDDRPDHIISVEFSLIIDSIELPLMTVTVELPLI